MTIAEKRVPRVHITSDLAQDAELELDERARHYLTNVLRKAVGDQVRLFNGRDGEWLADFTEVGKRLASVRLMERLSEQATPPDVLYCFALLKHARQDYMAQKATELGAAVLQPIITERTIAQRVKTERLQANAVEAAEQCGVLWVPEVRAPVSLAVLLDAWEPGRTLVFCDEAAPVADPVAALKQASPGAIGIVVGPEGGFTDQERALLSGNDTAISISLGPRTLRADTAAIAALTLVQTVLGDWCAGVD
ncbi:MAG: 16S rRNA (uracil(1498)-N(3))-methyltransferase [Pseudomonadota bacterium]